MQQQQRGGFKGSNRGRGHRGRGGHQRGRGQSRGGFRGRPQGGRQGFSQRTPVEPRRDQENEALKKVQIVSVDASSLEKPTSIEKSALIAFGQPGTGGVPVSLLTNYFPLKLPTKSFYQYSVQFSPEIENPRLARYLLGIHDNGLFKGKPYVFDGQGVLYTQIPLRKKPKEKIQLDSKSKDGTTYKIKIQLASIVSSSNVTQSVIQLFNIMYRRALRHLKLQQIGRNHYNMKHAIEIPKHKVKVIPGLLETIYMTSNGILFNADVIYKTLRTDTVLHMIYDMKKKYSNNYKQRVNEELKNSIVFCSYSNRTIHIEGVEWNKNPRCTFNKQGNNITFIKYYEMQYNIKIKDHNQPLLIHKPKRGEKRIEYFIPELCSLTGITNSMRKDNKFMKEIRAKGGLIPVDRAKQILSFVQESSQNKEFEEELRKWQLEIDPRLLKIKGRVLDKQTILFGQNKEKQVNDKASWEIKDVPLYKPVSIQNWLVIQPTNCEEVTENFLDWLFKVARPLGIKLGEPIIRTAANDDPSAYLEALKNIKPGTQFVLIILPDEQKQRYDAVKKELILKTGIPSQCVKYQTIFEQKGLPSKATKIVVQMAAKAGGAPWTLKYSFPKQKVMIVGMDVYHSGELVNRTKSSIVGFTATMNDTLTKYYSRVLVNKPGKELVDALQPVLEDALKAFKQLNNQYPDHIIFYRDGVGEGQVKDVLDKEVKSVEKAIENVKIENKPKLCFLVVLKRIHTRLFYENNGTLNNPAPGTVVDTEITNKDALEFFLVSQSVNQGTATPTRYQCIHNTSKFSNTYLQKLTYMLCHHYFNWFGTIRVPAPCMYAHKLAYLAGQSLEKEHPQRKQSDLLYYL